MYFWRFAYVSLCLWDVTSYCFGTKYEPLKGQAPIAQDYSFAFREVETSLATNKYNQGLTAHLVLYFCLAVFSFSSCCDWGTFSNSGSGKGLWPQASPWFSGNNTLLLQCIFVCVYFYAHSPLKHIVAPTFALENCTARFGEVWIWNDSCILVSVLFQEVGISSDCL